MNQEYVVEPIDFVFTDRFFRGFSEVSNKKSIVVHDVNDAYMYAFEQKLPAGYKIWTDLIEHCRKSLRQNAEFQEAHDFVTRYLENVQNQHSSDLIQYRIKKVKKINNKRDDFMFSDARDDAFSVLSTVAINRYLGNFIKDMFLEDVFGFYRSGGWPCGMKGKTVLVFDPASLS